MIRLGAVHLVVLFLGRRLVELLSHERRLLELGQVVVQLLVSERAECRLTVVHLVEVHLVEHHLGPRPTHRLVDLHPPSVRMIVAHSAVVHLAGLCLAEYPDSRLVAVPQHYGRSVPCREPWPTSPNILWVVEMS